MFFILSKCRAKKLLKKSGVKPPKAKPRPSPAAAPTTPSSSVIPIQLDAEASPARVVMSSHEGLDDDDSPAKGTVTNEESAPAKGDDNTATGEATANDPVVETTTAGTAGAVPASASAETSGSKPSGSEPLKDLLADVTAALKHMAQRSLEDVPDEDPEEELSAVKLEEMMELVRIRDERIAQAGGAAPPPFRPITLAEKCHHNVMASFEALTKEHFVSFPTLLLLHTCNLAYIL